MVMQTLPIHWPGLPANVGVLSTVRTGGISAAPFDDGAGGGGLNLGTHVGDMPEAVAHNRALLRALLPADPAWLSQVHGVDVVDAREALQRTQMDQPLRADASIAAAEGAVCAIMTADCMPVLLADIEGRVVGAAHAGWRGLAGGVLENTVAQMRKAGAGELMAWLGPAIGAERFEVGEDVPLAFQRLGDAAEQAFRPIADSKGKFLADLPALARLALTAAGVDRLAGGEHCTVSEPERFYSFRRDRVTGRMASLIWIKPLSR